MRASALTALLVALSWSTSLGASCAARPVAESPRVHEARGTIRSFGPDRAYANIHHEAIAGYMETMTMSFEAREPGQLSPFQVSDRVVFSFSDTEGRRVLLSIRKE